jgi:hypothetical protein
MRMGTFGMKKLYLGKEYNYRVTVSGLVGNFYADLKLSSDNITIRISGDETGLRTWGPTEWELESLECSGIGINFLLFDLHCIRSGTHAIGEMPSFVTHIDVEYIASYAIISQSKALDLKFQSIHLYSSTLAEWVGYTEKQQEIIEDQMGGSRVGLISNFGEFDTTEFCIGTEEGCQVAINYNIKAKANPFEFEVGVHFPPSFAVFSGEQILSKDIMHLYQKSYSLLSLLHGHELAMDHIELWEDDADAGEALLYYPISSISPKDIISYSWFPLGHNLRFNDLNLPPFPLDAINKYFSKEYMLSNKWWKYIKYRRMENAEERFLGYFRLLESLTKKSKSFLDPELLKSQVGRIEKIMIKIFGAKKEVQSFLGGIERHNNSKYNTAKCILDFYKKLPPEVVGKWNLKKEAITSICKLRNDISHANDYFESPNDLLDKCAFVESLLLIALLETVDVPISVSSKMICRLPWAYRLFEQ